MARDHVGPNRLISHVYLAQKVTDRWSRGPCATPACDQFAFLASLRLASPNGGVLNHSLYSQGGRNQSPAVVPTGPFELSPILGRTWIVTFFLIFWASVTIKQMFPPSAIRRRRDNAGT